MGLIYSNIPELDGSDTEISLSNLSALESELESVLERRIAHISELADAVVKDGGDADIIKSIILSIRSDDTCGSESIIDENAADIRALFSKISLAERLMIFRAIFSGRGFDKKGMYKHSALASDFIPSADASEKIAYLKNSYNDVVYSRFAELFSSPRAMYLNTVNDVCESVFNGDSEYCILPIETSHDGKLSSFYGMIFKYGLKINAVCDVDNNADGDCTKYALLSKKVVFEHPFMRSKQKNKYFELIYNDTDALSLNDMLISAEMCSLRLRRIDTLSIVSKDKVESLYFCPVFKINEGDIQTFISFLTVDCPNFIPVGLYLQI